MAAIEELVGLGTITAPLEQKKQISSEQDEFLPRGRVQTHGGWILYIGDNRYWEIQEESPYPARIGSFEVTVLSEMELVGSKRLHVFNIEGAYSKLGKMNDVASGRIETQVVLAQHLDLDILRRLERV